jgi:hypothetical protein
LAPTLASRQAVSPQALDGTIVEKVSFYVTAVKIGL